ncbi:EGF-like domain protein [Necator americanus]|uniref:EGF-like domain protein n=1 Tax=Necator americanus TaxID=51031 RepID=W2TF20_NECAM|nr:EGF-like domain protein [Necator americanus]ETN80423.1 EGF-like domain protein [Necator americanus]
MRQGLFFIGLLAQVLLGSTEYYEIEGHFSNLRYFYLSDGPENLAAKRQAVEQLSQKLSASLDGDLSDFYVNNFEIHGIGAGIPTVIFHGFLTTSSALSRQEIIDQITASGNIKLYYLGKIDSLPPLPSVEDSDPPTNFTCYNGGILLPNNTCVCPGFVSGKQCEIISCLHSGILDKNRCTCPPGAYALNCEPRGCMPSVQANMDTTHQSFILVMNLRSTMAYDLHLLIGQMPTWISDINKAAPGLIDNYLVTTYLQYKDTYYMKNQTFTTSADMLEYLNGLVISAGDDDQPTIAAINSAQSFSSLMHPTSVVYVFADSPDSSDVPYNPKLSSNSIEINTIQVMLSWRNKLVILLSETDDAPMDYFGDYYDIFRRVVKATQGDLIVYEKENAANIIDQLLPYYYQMENMAALYGISPQDDVVVDIRADYPSQVVYILITAENSPAPGVLDQNGSPPKPETSGRYFKLFRTTATAMPKITVTSKRNASTNVRVWINSPNTVFLASNPDPTVDVGSAVSVSKLTTYTTAFIAGFVSSVTIATYDMKGSPIRKAAVGSSSRNAECTYPHIFPAAESCTLGPFVQELTFTTDARTVYRLIPGFCAQPDHPSPIPFSCFNGGTKTGTATCRCTNLFTGRNCATPVCLNGGEVEKFPGNGQPTVRTVITPYSTATTFLNATTSAAILYQNSQYETQPSLDALWQTIESTPYDKSSIFLFTDAAPSSSSVNVDITSIALLAIERQLQINVIITAPYQMSSQCMMGAFASIYSQLTYATGGTILNLCEPYRNFYPRDIITEFFTGYGITHHHVETLQEVMISDCSISTEILFYIDDPSTQVYAFVNSATSSNPVVHVSSQFQSDVQPNIVFHNSDETVRYNATGTRRLPSCHYESFYGTPFTCNKLYSYFLATIILQTNEATMQRTQRAYCYLEPTVCLNGGTSADDNTCNCRPSFNGAKCESPICQNGGVVVDYKCVCEAGYTGQFCQYVACQEWNYLETHDVRQHEFRQITFVVEKNIGMVLPTVYLQQMIAGFVNQTESNNIPKQYSLVTFDENVVTNVVSTSNTDQFVNIFNSALNNSTNTDPVSTLAGQAIEEAYKITIQPPSIIYLFTSHNFTKFPNTIIKQRLGTQLLGVLVSAVKENALLYDDGFKDCTTPQTVSFFVESTASRVILDITGNDVTTNGAVSVADGQGNAVPVKSGNALMNDAAALVVEFPLKSGGPVGGKWTVTIKTTSGSCFIQARTESSIHVIPGFSSSRDVDMVKSGPFSTLGTNPSVYVTARVTNSRDANYGVTLDSLTITNADYSAPWNDKPLTGQSIHPRDPVGCANQFVTDVFSIPLLNVFMGLVTHTVNAFAVTDTQEISAMIGYALMVERLVSEHVCALTDISVISVKTVST